MDFKSDNDYIKRLKERAKKSRVYRKYQLTGLVLSKILQDESHKTLYFRVAQRYADSDLIALARQIAEKQGVRNKGAYFMRMLASSNLRKLKVVRSVKPIKKPEKKKVIQKTIFDALPRVKKKS